MLHTVIVELNVKHSISYVVQHLCVKPNSPHIVGLHCGISYAVRLDLFVFSQ